MEELKELLEGNTMMFKFQPIVSVVSGEVFGYEALIRSDIPGLEEPWDIISLAAEFSMLHTLETKVQLHLLEFYKQNTDKLKNKYLFFNSIPAESVNEDIHQIMAERYSEYLPNIAIEISECEQHSEEVIKSKSKFIRQYGGKIAFDNYGAGLHSEESIFSFGPDFIKIDFCIINYLDENEECAEFLRDFVISAHKNNVKIIALGIERSSQLELAIELGVDYLQGFYITHPSFDIVDEMDENLKRQILEATMRRQENV